MYAQHENMEQQIMETIRPFIRELLMVDVADFISYLNFQHHHQIKDIVDSAAEQFFAPGFLAYRELGEAHIDWNTTPTIKLELAMSAPDVSFEFELSLGNDAATVRFIKANDQARVDTSQPLCDVLRRAIEINRV